MYISVCSHALVYLNSLCESTVHVVDLLDISATRVGDPKYQEQSKMGYSNLAVVFCPSFFRAPDCVELTEVMQNAVLEQKFLTCMFESPPPKTV